MLNRIKRIVGYSNELNIKDKMAYYIAVLILMLLLGYHLFFAYVLNDSFMLILVYIPMVLCLVSFIFFRIRNFVIGKTILLSIVMFNTIVGTYFLFFSSSLISLYLLCIPPGAYTLYYVEKKLERRITEIFAVISFVAIVVTIFVPSKELVNIPEQYTNVYQAINIIVVAFLITFMQFIYALDMNRFQHRISILATRDSLTDIYNRRVFFETGNRMFSESTQHPFGIILLDVDHFKQINDQYGHLVGDEVLKKITRTISQNIREDEDIYRYGGEEFVVISPCSKLENLEFLAERLRCSIENLRFEASSGEIIRVTISLGGACTKHGFEKFDDMIRAADDALYQAKMNGRNCCLINSNMGLNL